MKMSPKTCFEMCFPGIMKNEISLDQENFSIKQMPYRLIFKDISGYNENCRYCN